MKSLFRKSFSLIFILCFMLVGLSLFGATSVNATSEKTYVLYSGALTEGDYIIYYGGKAMNTTVASKRLSYSEVTPSGDIITTDNASIVWHIAPSATDGYWTIYNLDEEKYVASTGAANKAQLLADGTDDKALWTITGTSTYDVVNKYNSDNTVNAYLRNNGTYGFACYASGTGGALRLYKLTTYTVSFNTNGGSAVASIEANVGVKISSPSAPTKLGFVFDGWYKEAGLVNLWDFANDTVTTDVTLYAKWNDASSSATISFDKNDISASGSMDSQVMDKLLGGTLCKCAFTKYGYDFDGWAITSSGDVVYSDEDTIDSLAGDLTLYAKWSKKTVDELLSPLETMASLYVDYNRLYTTSTLAYTDDKTTTNMTGGNDASMLGLDNKVFSVVGTKGSASNFPGLNKDGTIRLYYNVSGSNEITVTRNEGIITSITVNAKSSNNNYYIKVNGVLIEGTNNNYLINYSSFVIGNNNTSNVQVHIEDIAIGHNDDGEPSYSIVKEESKNKVAMKFGACITNEMKDFLDTYGTPIKFGIAYKVSDGSWKYKELTGVKVASPFADAVDDGGDYFQFIMKLNHIPSSDFDTVITAKAYVEIGGVKYYMAEKAYSVNSMCSNYLAHKNDSGFESVLDHVGALTWLSTYSE